MLLSIGKCRYCGDSTREINEGMCVTTKKQQGCDWCQSCGSGTRTMAPNPRDKEKTFCTKCSLGSKRGNYWCKKCDARTMAPDPDGGEAYCMECDLKEQWQKRIKHSHIFIRARPRGEGGAERGSGMAGIDFLKDVEIAQELFGESILE